VGRVTPLRLIVVGAVLLVVGAVLPFLMVVRLLESQLWLNFVAVASTMAGLVVGMYGIFELQRTRERDKQNHF